MPNIMMGLGLSMRRTAVVVPPAPSVPVISGVPTVAGTPGVGNVLTLTAGPVSGYPAPVRTWQLRRDGVTVGAPFSGTEYTQLVADAGTDLTFEQIETNASGTDTAISAAVSVPGESGSPPLLAMSSSLAGRTITYAVGSVTGSPTPTVSLTALTRNGSNAIGTAVETVPGQEWTYTQYDAASVQTIVATFTATNGNAPDDTDQITTPIAANVLPPEAFTAGQWGAAPGADGEIAVTISALPYANLSAITDIEYRIEGGAAVSSGGVVGFTVGSLAAGATDIEIRAVNARGAGPWSDLKTVTVTETAAPETLAIVQAPNETLQEYGTTVQVDITAVTNGNHLLVGTMAWNSAGVPTISSPGVADWGAPIFEDVGAEVTTRYYKREAMTDGATYVRATYPNAGELQLGVVELNGGATLALTDTGSAAQSASATWDYPFTSDGDDAVMMGFAKLSNSATASSIAPAVATNPTNGWYVYIRGLFPTAGANTAQFSLGADSRSGPKTWVVVEAVGVGSGGGGGGDPAPEGLAPVWTVEYVDPAGARQLVTVADDGSTAISINQYANVTFDGRGTRSASTGCNTAPGAAQKIGYGYNYGEALGGTWATDGRSNDVDAGPPIASRCFTVAGARSVSLYARDPDGREETRTLTVNVVALGSVVDISAGGAWPTWASDTVYGLSSGDYTARGPIETPALHGIRVIKIGGGTDPIVDEFRPETRGVAHGSLITDRSKDIVLVNIDYAKFATGVVGADYCGSYGGNCRHFGAGTTASQAYVYDNDGIAAGNQINADNVKVQRGTFVVNASGIDGSEGLPNYAILAMIRSANFAGSVIRRTTGDSGGNPMRTYFDATVLRHIQVYSTTETFGFLKGSCRPNVYSATPDDAWPDDDTYGDYAQSRASYLANGSGYEGGWGTGGSYFWVHKSVFGGPGTWSPTYIGGINAQNNDAVSPTGPWSNETCYESPYTSGVEDCALTINTAANFTLSGRDLSFHGNTQLSGSAWGSSLNSNPNKTHPDFLGPYHTTARPVPSALVGLV